MLRYTLPRATRLALGLLAATLVVAGCGRQKADEAPPAATTTAAVAPTQPAAQPAVQADAARPAATSTPGESAHSAAFPTATPTATSVPAAAAAPARPGLIAHLAPRPTATPARSAPPTQAPKPAGRSLAAAPAARPVAAKPAPSAAPAALPDRLVLPALGLDTPVVELGWNTQTNRSGQVFSEWDVAEYAAGWHKNSALPGQGDNIVFSGHNNILGAVFRELDRLQRGDVAQLYVGDKVFEYAIDKVMIVPEKHATEEQRKANSAWIAPTGEEQLTLVSCWPRDDNTHRIIVVAHPVVKAVTSNGQ